MNPDRDPFRLDQAGAGGPRRPMGSGPGATLARIVGAIAAAAFFALALFLGAFVFVGLLGAAIIGTLAFRVWLWWQTRSGAPGTRGAGSPGGSSSRQTANATGRRRAPRHHESITVVDAEYEVVDERNTGAGRQRRDDGRGDTGGSD